MRPKGPILPKAVLSLCGLLFPSVSLSFPLLGNDLSTDGLEICWLFGGPSAHCLFVGGPRTVSVTSPFAVSFRKTLLLGLLSSLFKASYLVDPSSSHMLVSKIKPCMSKYNPLEGETAKGSLNHT